MDSRQQRELTELLLACPSMGDRHRRDNVVESLPDRVKANDVERSKIDRDDIGNILKQCLNYSHGLEDLIAAVRLYDGGTWQMEEVDRLLLRLFDFDIDQDEAHLALLAIAARVDVPASRQKEFYRSLLPDGVPQREEPLGLFAMLAHLWNLSRKPEAQTSRRTYAIADFVEQIARATTGRVATELREWVTQVTPVLFGSGGLVTDITPALEAEPWTHDSRRLTVLASILAYLYPTIEGAGEIVAGARLNPVRIDFREMSLANWQNILAEATKREKTGAVIDAALSEHPDNEWLLLAKKGVGPDQTVGERRHQSDATQRGRPEEEREDEGMPKSPVARGLQPGATTRDAPPTDAPLAGEKAAGQETRQAPPSPEPLGRRDWPQDISFLEKGLAKARSVAKVDLAPGSATGFLIEDNLLILPSFAVGTPEEAQKAVVLFNYQRTMDELYAPTAAEYRLAPEQGFFTSAEHKWTAVRVEGNPNSDWGALPLAYAHPQINDLLSIIHHGWGDVKQIELLNTVVLAVDSHRIQSTPWEQMGGSAGAPVFDENWDVVAMHHSAGLIPDLGSSRLVRRREATLVNAIVDGLVAAGLYSGDDPPE